MTKDTKKLFSALVAAAVLNKYGDVSFVQIGDLVSRTIDAVGENTEAELISRLRPVRAFVDDVNNQTIVLTLIERCWSNPPKLDRPLATLNASSFGRSTPAFRSTGYVEDFGRDVPTHRREIRARLDELERLCRHSVRSMSDSRLEDKAVILAHIFGSLIRIHPFKDGNGRTSRLFVFYALRCWGLPLFPIPKVRNDRKWKVALDSAVAGDALKLTKELYCRMKVAIQVSSRKRSVRAKRGYV